MFVAEFKQFKAQLAFNYIYNFFGQVCGGIGYNTDAMTASIYMRSNFWQCSKVVIGDIADYSGQWTGK